MNIPLELPSIDAGSAPAVPAICWPDKFRVYNVLVSATNYQELTEAIISCAKRKRSAIVSCHAVHAIVTASEDSDLCKQVNHFEAVTPDGQPVRWALKWLHGKRLNERVYGPELMLRVCGAAADNAIPIYLYGGTESVLRDLIAQLQHRFPSLRIFGESPPFRPLTPEEDEQAMERIRSSGAGCVFIGLGYPKQDIFAAAHREKIQAVQLCVGAAFDFHAGNKRMAPAWLQRVGLEWLFRLCQEPRRLWRRYATTNFKFIFAMIRQFFRSPTSRTTILNRDS